MSTRSQQTTRMPPVHWLVISIFFETTVQFTSFGTEFIIAIPRIFAKPGYEPPSISFFMGTVDERGASVFITTPYFEPDNETLHELFHLEYRNISSFSPPSIFHSETYIGPKWSFRFIGNVSFSLSVFLMQYHKSVASFQAVPINSWGKKYVAFTLGQYPSIQVISSTDDNSILVFFSFNRATTDVKLRYKNQTYTDGRSLHLTLNRWQAFAVSNCDSKYPDMLSLTGTVLYGDFPIGVISGNCESRTYTFGCKVGSRGYRNGETMDIAGEMLLPEEAFGKIFIIFSLPRRTPGSATIISSEENTEVNISNEWNGTAMMVRIEVMSWNYEVRMTKNRQIVSNKRIQVILMTLSTCIGRGALNDLGDPAISLVLPNSLFGTEYFWITPDGIGYNYATLVMEMDTVKSIRLNGEPLIDYSSDRVMGNQNYEVSTFRLHAKHNHIFAMKIKFACYVYGLDHGVQYMHPAGFDGCMNTVESMFAGDLLDNDCDDEVDEELKDGEDNDSDGRIDEDLIQLDFTNGMWGEWLPWTCNPNCTHPFYFQMRLCDSPPPSGGGITCQGEPSVMIMTRCQPNIRCPRRCPQFTWGDYCNRSCINCGIDCDPDTGRCDYCKMGFKRREAGCDRRCGENEYGHDCLLSCSEKCGADCVNRETGECPEFNRYLMVMLGVIVFTLGLLLLWLRKQTQKSNKSFTTVKENESEMNASVISVMTSSEQNNEDMVPSAEPVTPFETSLT